MTIFEFATLVQENANVKVAIVNNGYLGMVRQWQQFFHNRNYSETPISSPDFMLLAQAYGIRRASGVAPGRCRRRDRAGHNLSTARRSLSSSSIRKRTCTR